MSENHVDRLHAAGLVSCVMTTMTHDERRGGRVRLPVGERARLRRAVRGLVRPVRRAGLPAAAGRLERGRDRADPGRDRRAGGAAVRDHLPARPLGRGPPQRPADPRVRRGRGRRRAVLLLLRGPAHGGRSGDAHRVHRPRRGRGLAVAAARAASRSGHAGRRRPRRARPGAGARPALRRRPQPGRRALGAGRDGRRGDVLHRLRRRGQRPAADGARGRADWSPAPSCWPSSAWSG